MDCLNSLGNFDMLEEDIFELPRTIIMFNKCVDQLLPIFVLAFNRELETNG